MSDQSAVPEPKPKKTNTLLIVGAGCLVAFVFVAGILAAIAIPAFSRYQCRAKQTEASANLRALAIDEESFRREHGQYSRDAGEIGFNPAGLRRYEFHIVDATPTSFRAEARGIADMDGDLWQVDQTGMPKNVASTKCPRPD